MKSFTLAPVLVMLMLSGYGHAFEVREVSVYSRAMGIALPASVVLPDAYRRGDRRFPVIYVLHGWSGTSKDWISKTDIESLADEHDVILVMPDGNYDKWYIDSAAAPKNKYETYIGREVVGYIDKNFRTIGRREARAITGLSMGGFGALNIAVNNQEAFGAVGSMSGGVDPRGFRKNWGLEAVFGGRSASAGFWDEKAIINNAHRFISGGIDIAIECGVDDFFIESNRELHRKLLELRVPHDYTERPGGHAWGYWENAIRYQVLFFAVKFSEKPAKPD